jgi:hypothetical protein
MENNNFEKTFRAIIDSGGTADEKIAALSALIAGLNCLHHDTEIRRATETGIVIARQADRSEMVAQFYLMRAKSEMAGVSLSIKDMKELTMAPDWFNFSLESDKKLYKELDGKLQTVWSRTQAMIDLGYKFLNQKPFVGAAAYCHRTAGEIYASYYLQLKLHHFVVGRPWRARMGKYLISRWLGLDDLFIMTRKSRRHLQSVKKDCLKSLHMAVDLFKKEKAYDYVVETYFDLALEHHSFNDSIRSQFYLWQGWFLMKKWKLNEPRLINNFIAVQELPLIGSSRNG